MCKQLDTKYARDAFPTQCANALKCNYAHTLPVKFASAYAEDARTEIRQVMEKVSRGKNI